MCTDYTQLSRQRVLHRQHGFVSVQMQNWLWRHRCWMLQYRRMHFEDSQLSRHSGLCGHSWLISMYMPDGVQKWWEEMPEYWRMYYGDRQLSGLLEVWGHRRVVSMCLWTRLQNEGWSVCQHGRVSRGTSWLPFLFGHLGVVQMLLRQSLFRKWNVLFGYVSLLTFLAIH